MAFTHAQHKISHYLSRLLIFLQGDIIHQLTSRLQLRSCAVPLRARILSQNIVELFYLKPSLAKLSYTTVLLIYCMELSKI